MRRLFFGAWCSGNIDLKLSGRDLQLFRNHWKRERKWGFLSASTSIILFGWFWDWSNFRLMWLIVWLLQLLLYYLNVNEFKNRLSWVKCALSQHLIFNSAEILISNQFKFRALKYSFTNFESPCGPKHTWPKLSKSRFPLVQMRFRRWNKERTSDVGGEEGDEKYKAMIRIEI